MTKLSETKGIVLGTHYKIESEEFKTNLADKIFLEYSTHLTSVAKNNNHPGKRVSLKKHKYVMSIVLSCLFREWTSYNKVNRCVRYYRSNDYYKKTPYSLKLVKNIIDWLSSNNYIITYIGGYNRSTKKRENE